MQICIIAPYMVDPERHNHTDRGEESLFSSFSSAEELRRFNRIEQLTRAHSILGHALDLDAALDNGHAQGITKKFVIYSGGGSTYPFPHFRVKLRSKTYVSSGINVVALRYPVQGLESERAPVDFEKLFVAWETREGEERAFVLDVDSFSRLELPQAFGDVDDSGSWPSLVSRSQSDDIDQFSLETVLNDFEPDLQTRRPVVEA